MSVSQFWLLRDRRTGIYIAHTVPFKGAIVCSGLPSRCFGKCESVGTTAESYSGRMASPRSWTSWVTSPDSRQDSPTVLEHGAPGDSQRNGFVERTIRSVEDMVRTHKLALEEKIGEVLKVDTAAMAWLVEHFADILNKCQQGKDGRTPYERLRGKQFSGFMLESGSQVMLKVMDKVRRRCDAGALGGRHLVGKSVYDARTLGCQEVGRSGCQDSGCA